MMWPSASPVAARIWLPPGNPSGPEGNRAPLVPAQRAPFRLIHPKAPHSSGVSSIDTPALSWNPSSTDRCYVSVLVRWVRACRTNCLTASRFSSAAGMDRCRSSAVLMSSRSGPWTRPRAHWPPSILDTSAPSAANSHARHALSTAYSPEACSAPQRSSVASWARTRSSATGPKTSAAGSPGPSRRPARRHTAKCRTRSGSPPRWCPSMILVSSGAARRPAQRRGAGRPGP